MATQRQLTVLDHLAPSEHGRVLAALLAARPELRDHVDELARRELSSVDSDAVATEVAEVYLGQSFQEIGDRAGRQPGRGYVHEVEAQWELLEETLEPFVADIDRLARAGMPGAATRQALGAIAGLEELRECAGEETLIGWGELDQHVSELIETVEHACRKVDLDLGGEAGTRGSLGARGVVPKQ